ncbi:MAG: ferrochelatase [Cyclobacteriaceae bacterium]|nr:ferrochelatase [Cyclobacteriaceae bacterium]
MQALSKKTGVLLVNLGTPDSPSVKDVRSYLFQFLNDKRVIDIPLLARKLLVNLIIVPFRAPKSAKIYQELWTEKGSPIMIYGREVRSKLEKILGKGYDVHLAMRYKSPSLKAVLAAMKKKNYDKIIVLPMFPQYASATTGSVQEEVMRIVSQWWVIPEIRFISQFYDHPYFINAWKEIGVMHNWQNYDHVIFSYHGLPLRHVDKVYEEGICDDHNCENEITPQNKFCYKATCYATTRMLAKELEIPESHYTVAFQSRLDKDWLEPFSDKVVIEKAESGCKKLLVFSPAFTADCLETIVEIGIEYKELFKLHGGEELHLVESLNDHPSWIRCMASLVTEKAT